MTSKEHGFGIELSNIQPILLDSLITVKIPRFNSLEYAVVRNDFLPSAAITFSTHAGS